MSMIFCRGCGKQIHETAPACPHCGARQAGAATSPSEKPVPEGVKGWSWGAFLLSWVWAIGNKTWIGLLALIPYVGFIMAIVLGFKGREWAWKSKQWDDIEHFNRVQKKWSFWGVAIVGSMLALGLLAGIGFIAFEHYSKRAQRSEAIVPSLAENDSGNLSLDLEYEPLRVSDTSIGGIFSLNYDREPGGMAINYRSRRGTINLMESVVDDVNLTGYVAVEKAFKFDTRYLLIVSTGEQGLSCPATTYAFTFDPASERVSGKMQIDGCSESVIARADGNRLAVKKEGAQSVFLDGKVNAAAGASSSSTSSAATVGVPAPRGECDRQYAELLKSAQLTPKEVAVHGPVDEDFPGYGCPYRITPPPGSRATKGSAVTYRSAWEAG